MNGLKGVLLFISLITLSLVIKSEGYALRSGSTHVTNHSVENETSKRTHNVRKIGFHSFLDDKNSDSNDPGRNLNFLKLKSVPIAARAALLGMALAALLPSLGGSIGSIFGQAPVPVPLPYPAPYYGLRAFPKIAGLPHRFNKRSIKNIPKPSRFDYDEEQLIDIPTENRNLHETQMLLRDGDQISRNCLNDLHYVNASCQETFLCKINSDLEEWNSVCNQALELAIETSEVSGMNLALFVNERLFRAWKTGRDGLDCELVYNGCQKSVPQLLNAIGGLWVP